jgi:hypothetical protein
MAIGDVDADGALDIYLTQYKPPYQNGQIPTPYYDANDWWPSFLFLGDGQGGFRDATDAAGFKAKRFRRTYRASFVDLDDDRDLDLIVTNDFAGFDIYHNSGAGHFTDVTARLVDDYAVFGMSHTLADFNRDGRLDFYVTGMASTTARRLDQLGLGRDEFPDSQAMRTRMAYGNRMYLRAADDTYRQPEWKDQVARSGWSWGVAAEDFDLDRDIDLYIANGHRSGRSALDYCTRFWCHDIYFAGSDESDERYAFLLTELRDIGKYISWNGYEKKHFFLHVRRPSASDAGSSVSAETVLSFSNVAFLFGLAEEADGRNVASADFDRDGRPDLLLVRRRLVEEKPHLELVLYQNRIDVSGRHWIGVDLAPTSRTSPFGAKVTAVTTAGALVDAYVAGDSFGVQHAPTLHFGLGEEPTVLELRVDWPNGTTTKIAHPATGCYHAALPEG